MTYRYRFGPYPDWHHIDTTTVELVWQEAEATAQASFEQTYWEDAELMMEILRIPAHEAYRQWNEAHAMWMRIEIEEV